MLRRVQRRAFASKVIVPRHRDPLILQAGGCAPLADASCVARRGGTVVHASVAWRWASSDDVLHFTGGGAPLMVDFRHPASSAGLQPNTMNGRENARPSDQEVLAARCVDRALRPRFFSDGALEAVRVDVEVASSDGDGDVVTLGTNAASCALALAGIPWKGPVGASRLSRRGASFTRDPPLWFCEHGFDLLYATGDGLGPEKRCVSLELGCAPTRDAILIEALQEAHACASPIVDAINALAPAFTMDMPINAERDRLDALATISARSHLQELVAFFAGRAFQGSEDPASKRDRGAAQDRAFFKAIEGVKATLEGEPRAVTAAAKRAVEHLGREAMSIAAQADGRADGRRIHQLRDLRARCATLPQPHGSASFARGETEVAATVTLAAPPSRRVPSLDAEPAAAYREHAAWRRTDPRASRKRRPRESQFDREVSESVRNADRRLLLHYDFPASATGGTEDIMRANRRAVGHGALAERALASVFPNRTRFPYATTVRTSVTASSGSTSMAAVCAASLALHDCGVPLKAPVGAASVGLAGDALLVDPTGTEDHFGSMDCKVAGTRLGATAAQIDVKGDGVPLAVLAAAFGKASDARREVLVKMDACALGGEGIRVPQMPKDAPFALVHDAAVKEAPAAAAAPSFLQRLFGGAEPAPAPAPTETRPRKGKRPPTAAAPRARLKRHAPRVAVVRFDAARIGDLIGPRGDNLRRIEDETGADVDARTVPGEVTIFADAMAKCSRARKLVLDVVGEIRLGDEVRGTVTEVRDYGCLVQFSRSREGLVHKSEYRGWPAKLEELSVGDDLELHVIGLDPVLGVVKLSRRRRTAKPAQRPARPRARREKDAES